MNNYEFYSKYFKDLKQTPPKQNLICPFHEDKTPSFSIDLDKGLWYCQSEHRGGDIYSFYMETHGCNFKKAKSEIAGNRESPILSIANVNEAHKRLLKNESLQSILYAKRFWSKEIIEKLRLGWEDERVTIPVFDQEKQLLNIRKYDILHKTKDKFKGVPGHNETQLYPTSSISKDPIILFAGEPDTILAIQFGFPAITFTTGEGAFSKKYLPLFKNKTIYICYDIDEAGKRGSNIIANQLVGIAKQLKLIKLPEDLLRGVGKDFTDLVLLCLSDKYDFKKIWNKLVDDAEVFTLIEQQPTNYDDFIEVDFYKAIDKNYYGKNIHFKALAVGSSMSPYLCPRKITIKCDINKGESCKNCSLFMCGGTFDYQIPEDQKPQLINLSSEDQKKKIKSLVGVYKCNGFQLEINEIENIESVWITPTLDAERIEQKFISRKSYICDSPINTNKIYEFYGKTIPDPEDQTAIHWFTKAVPSTADLWNFKITEESIEALKIFQPEESTDEAIELKFLEIMEDLNYNAPGSAIIGREDLFIALDLVYHTVLSFNFLGNDITKGWGECLIIGDTGTGKTIAATKLMKHYRLGEYITLEKATTSGIVGGLSRIGNSNVFSWGIFPINDGRLVILDEANGLDSNAISDLSAIRSTGIAERTIVGSTRRTSARVRTIWISNPRSNARSIRYYSSGVEAIRELIGRPEDIQRFDFAIVIGADEVASELINSAIKKTVQSKYSSGLCNELLLWTWSRKPEHIKFEHEAEKLILQSAIEMGNKYSDNIPIVQATTQRIKLARLAIAAACRMFSTNDGKNVIVKPEHVRFIRIYLDRIYNTPNFNYGDWSLLKKQEGEITDKMDYIKKIIYSLVDPLEFCAKMLDAREISMSDLEDYTKYENRDKLKFFRSELVQNNCIKRIGNFYRKTPEFTQFLKPMLKVLQKEAKLKSEKLDKKSTEERMLS